MGRQSIIFQARGICRNSVFFFLCYSTLETNVFYLSILEDGALLGRFSHFVFYLAKIQ